LNYLSSFYLYNVAARSTKKLEGGEASGEKRGEGRRVKREADGGRAS